MVVKATCDKAGCPGYEVTEYTIDKTDALIATDSIVTISYEGKTATVEIVVEEVHVHLYDQQSAKVATPATCTENQFNYYACSCGETSTTTYEVENSALGHKYTSYVSNGDATCEADGTKTAKCDNGCGETDTTADEGSKLEHKYIDYTSNNDATCEADGTKTASCDYGCGESDTVVDEGSALGHKYTNYISNGDAICDVDGTKTASCDNGCGKTDTIADEGRALDHKYTEYISNGDATCEADGTKTASCDNGCGKTDTIADEGSAGHGNLASISISTQPTKTSYKAGDKFDASGMTVTASCEKAGCPGYEVNGYTVDKTDALTKADTTVTVSYEGKTATVAITVAPAVSYELTMSNNAGVISNPGKWVYSADGANGTEYEFAFAPIYEDGVITFAFNRMAEGSPTYQLRYQPNLPVGTEYTVTFTVEVSAAGRITYGNDYKVYDFAGAGSVTLTWTGTVDGTNKPFMVQIRSTDRTSPITMVVSNIHFEGEQPEQPEPEQPKQPNGSYNLTSSNNSGVVANPGQWFYSFDGANGTEYELASAPVYKDGVITYTFNRMAEGSPTYQLRYQPNLPVDTQYTITFTVEVSAAGKVVYGSDYKAYEFSEAGKHTITWTGKVSSSAPFSINVRSTDRSAPITVTVSDIKIDGEYLPVIHNLTSSNNSGVVANPGQWFYSADGANGNEYEFASTPVYKDGVITFAFNRMAEGSPTYQLRYQPNLPVDTQYTITFTVEVSAAGKVIYGTDYKTYEFTEAGTHTITWTGKVGNSPFLIGIRSTDRSAPITVTVSDVEIVEK